MIFLIIFLQLIFLYNFQIDSQYYKKEDLDLKGVYRIDSYLINKHFFINKNTLIISDKFSFFNIIKVTFNSYYIESRKYKKLLSAGDNNYNLIFIDKKKNININKIMWKIIKIRTIFYTI